MHGSTERSTRVSEAADLAQKFFDGGLNCAESTLAALAIHLGKAESNIPRIATAFGGGMSRTRNACGAVTGALMALGLLYGRSHASDDRNRCYSLAAELIQRVQERFGSTNCYQLTGLDFNQPEGQQTYKDKIHGELCVPLVRFAIDTVMELARRRE
jgi:C_GCAxxG_C_C family probable redox protein